MNSNGITHLQSEKFNIAWFKLAEFVARKEKERAFGMYRLLAHSIANPALEAQLEGDLLLAFNDNRADQAYRKAALLYEKEGKVIQAIAVTEHAMSLTPHILDCTSRLSYLYEKIHKNKKAKEYALCTIKLLLEKESIDYVINYCQKAALSINHSLMLLEQLSLEMLATGNYPEQIVKKVLDLLMPELLRLDDVSILTSWLERLEHVNVSAYEYAQTYLQ